MIVTSHKGGQRGWGGAKPLPCPACAELIPARKSLSFDTERFWTVARCEGCGRLCHEACVADGMCRKCWPAMPGDEAGQLVAARTIRRALGL